MDPKKLRKNHFNDRMATVLIKIGGAGVIFSMIIMMVFLVKMVLPLFYHPEIKLIQTWKQPTDTEVMGVDDYGETSFYLDKNAALHFYRIRNHHYFNSSQALVPTGRSFRAKMTGINEFAIHFGERVDSYRVEFFPEYDKQGVRSIAHRLKKLYSFHCELSLLPYRFEILHLENESLFLELSGGHHLSITSVRREEDLFGDIEELSESCYWNENLMITSFTPGENGKIIWAGTSDGVLIALELVDNHLIELDRLDLGKGIGIKHLTSVFGLVSVAAALENNDTSIFMIISGEMVKTHQFSLDSDHLLSVYPSQRYKNLIFLQKNSFSGINITSEKHLFEQNFTTDIKQLVLTRRGTFFSGIDSSGQVWMWHIDSPHPEVSFSVLWKKVWYEGYKQPGYSWQSSSASDDFEPKLSLVPLLFGSLKGTFYGMLFALPLALFGSVYTSQMMHPKWRKLTKPVIELMAAVPTVIVGFLAALWLAPVIERHLVGIVLLPILIPLLVVFGARLMNRFCTKSKFEGLEFLWSIPLVLLAVILSIGLGHMIEAQILSGDVPFWLFEHFNIQYDQRNSLVISFAMGFAVIPIMFTIAEDAMSNVPRHIISASLALGADSWQTVYRIVLPMASPGIFAAVMIGFGRAIGETMIVLMATGNTPIMDCSLFNGMRTLAANIAVEIPEAPVNGSLFRVLFLSSLLLFILTFIVNTLAEFVRTSLRRRYGKY